MPAPKLIAALLASACAAFPPAHTSAQTLLQTGDSVRFEERRPLDWRAEGGFVAHTRVQHFRHAGIVVALRGDTLTIRQDDQERHFAMAYLDDFKAWRPIREPHGRAFKRGAIIGGGLIGAGALAFAVCNPTRLADGCRGGSSLERTVATTAVGSVAGAAAFGIVAAMFAPKHGWSRADLAYLSALDGGSMAFGVRIPFAP